MGDKPSNALGDTVRLYRQYGGLTQGQLVELMTRLAAAGRIRTALTQQHISAIESGHHRALLDSTLEALTVSLSVAMMEAGFAGADEATVALHLRNARMGSAGVDVPPDLLAFDAELAPYPRWYRNMILSLARALHNIISTTIDAQLRKPKRTQRSPGDSVNDGD